MTRPLLSPDQERAALATAAAKLLGLVVSACKSQSDPSACAVAAIALLSDREVLALEAIGTLAALDALRARTAAQKSDLERVLEVLPGHPSLKTAKAKPKPMAAHVASLARSEWGSKL